MKSIVGCRGQITIPKKLRERLGIRPGQTLEFEEDRGRIVVRKAPDRDPIVEVYGILKLDRSVDELIAEMRGEPEV